MEIFFILFLAACIYFVYLQERNRWEEGFATHAIDEKLLPKCFLRSAEAQGLVARLAPIAAGTEEFKELMQILQKVLCIDADVTGSGVGGYATIRLPFATAHDIEPVGSFVGRCLANAVKQRDIDIAFEKYATRGDVLISTMCGNASKERQVFKAIITDAAAHVSNACLRPNAPMDRPAGVRDPGYFEPAALSVLPTF